MTVSGIDVASYQPADYDTTGLAFVAVKATEGTSYVNPKHTDQVAHARAHGLVVMHYHFVRPGSMSAQLTYFLQHAAPAAGDVLALDWEDAGVSCADKDGWIRDARQAAPAHRVILYCNRDFWFHHDTTSFCGDGLWIADPDAPAGHPQIRHPWLMHQYSETGGMDHDVANFPDAAALRAWAAKSAPPPPPAPVVHLAHIDAAARRDPAAPQGHTTYKSEVLVVERALAAEHLLDPHWVDGSFGTRTVAAYAAWQRHLGYSGSAADGIPGRTSLTRLGKRHGFTVA